MAAINKDVVLGSQFILSVVSLVLLFGVTWYFQSSLDLLLQQVIKSIYDRELLFKLQEQFSMSIKQYSVISYSYSQQCVSNGYSAIYQQGYYVGNQFSTINIVLPFGVTYIIIYIAS